MLFRRQTGRQPVHELRQAHLLAQKFRLSPGHTLWERVLRAREWLKTVVLIQSRGAPARTEIGRQNLE